VAENWINGVVEHRGKLYAIEGPAQQASSGHYFLEDDVAAATT